MNDDIKLPPLPASAEASVILGALFDLVNVLRKRHYGRMPDEVREAYERAWAIVFSSPAKLPSAPVAQEPVVVAWVRPDLVADGKLLASTCSVHASQRPGYLPLQLAASVVQKQPVRTADDQGLASDYTISACYFPGTGEAELSWQRTQDGEECFLTVPVTPEQGKRLASVVFPCVYYSAARGQTVPDGWKLVPVEPTREMMERGDQELSGWIAPAMHSCDAYRAMLKAAPVPAGPSSAQQKDTE